MHRVHRAALIAAAVGMLASCGKSSDATPTSPGNTGTNVAAANVAEIQIPASDFYGVTTFSPDTVTIAVGGRVDIANNDTILHHPTSDDGSWGGDLSPGEAMDQVFSTPGTYSYHCSIHPGMTGTIVVK